MKTYNFKDSLSLLIKTNDAKSELSDANYQHIKAKTHNEEQMENIGDHFLIYSYVSSTKEVINEVINGDVGYINEEQDKVYIDINEILLYFKRTYNLLNNYDYNTAKFFIYFSDYTLAVNIELQKVIVDNKPRVSVVIDVIRKSLNLQPETYIHYETLNSDVIANSKEEASVLEVGDKDIKLHYLGDE